jgi:glycosyltransferase involved in cell wall biosynthesis
VRRTLVVRTGAPGATRLSNGDLFPNVSSVLCKVGPPSEPAPDERPGVERTYAVVTAARDEAANLPRLASSLKAQTLVPVEWIIVDNGSTDSTREVAEGLARETPWIRALFISSNTAARGGPVVRAFNAGLSALQTLPDIMIKLDADVAMEPDYFEQLLARFALDESLGMASGTAYEPSERGWRERPVTAGHVWGPARAYRWACLQDVLPLEERMGWDGIDELKAELHGWKTATFRDLPFRHHRAQGMREGARWRHWRAQGAAAHYMGYRPLYLILRALFSARREPAALGMVWGFVVPALTRQSRVSDRELRRRLRQRQGLRTLPARAREALGKTPEA